MLHHLDQTEHGSDDSDRRRKPTGGFEELGNLFFLLFFVIQFKLHDLAKFLRVGPVDRQHERPVQKRFVDGFEFSVE